MQHYGTKSGHHTQSKLFTSTFKNNQSVITTSSKSTSGNVSNLQDSINNLITENQRLTKHQKPAWIQETFFQTFTITFSKTHTANICTHTFRRTIHNAFFLESSRLKQNNTADWAGLLKTAIIYIIHFDYGWKHLTIRIKSLQTIPSHGFLLLHTKDATDHNNIQ